MGIVKVASTRQDGLVMALAMEAALQTLSQSKDSRLTMTSVRSHLMANVVAMWLLAEVTVQAHFMHVHFDSQAAATWAPIRVSVEKGAPENVYFLFTFQRAVVWKADAGACAHRRITCRSAHPGILLTCQMTTRMDHTWGHELSFQHHRHYLEQECSIFARARWEVHSIFPVAFSMAQKHPCPRRRARLFFDFECQ
mmetsp:Transcript_55152/g.110751  ORF Transcript_55152/g.110751 Transcript_55152/m.110751 type:complete len:196 (-) Transcript_55152:32-619(-)